MDLPPQPAGVGLGLQGRQVGLLGPAYRAAGRRLQDLAGQHPIIGRAGLIPFALEATVHHCFTDQVQYRLEAVVVCPHLVVEGVEHCTLCGTVSSRS